ncbi:OpgC [Candidatus Burkholderia verschuerenii]|uniref:OpgC n=1 Tax=Candidatus Burkholderia verschuerenii TaxID=242163 RepID=A0A0L0MH04_9BURK|nr:DUF2946 domain-containing protein [Candidatus Burkholderia verschuerenii]KND61566.1 OpgC [Candidatus Burkholderia verschuerenii]
MTRNARNCFVAWLGIAAMWLAIVAPVISQTLASHRAQNDFQAALCTVDAPNGAYSHASHHDASAAADEHSYANADEHAGHHDASDHFDACSYCGLLAHNLPIAQEIALDVTRIERVARVASLVAVSAPVSKS